MEFKEGLTFDDVLLVPKYSDITSRSQTNLITQLSRNISLNIPFVSANMDTVTESSMAVAIARAGGIGIIHRFLTIQEQANQVLKVKRSGSVMIENPYSITSDKTIETALDYADDKDISGLLVVDSTSKLIGIVTERDLLFANSKNLIQDVMTKDVVTAKYGISIDEAKDLLHKHRIEKLPLVDESGFVKGLITSKDITNNAAYPNASKDGKGRPLVGAAVGVKGDFLERSESLLEAGADTLVVDIAHGHSENAISTVKHIKKAFPNCELIAGNIATAKGAEDLMKAGVDAVKVGVGSGSICITRVITGSGVPQLTAVMDCAKVGRDYGIPVISDGGTRNSGDATKALNPQTKYRIVRLGNVIYSTDSVLEKWRDKIQNNEEVIITEPKATRFFMTKERSVDMIFNCLEKSKDSTPYFEDMKSTSMGNLLQAMSNKYLQEGSELSVNEIGLQPNENLHERVDRGWVVY